MPSGLPPCLVLRPRTRSLHEKASLPGTAASYSADVRSRPSPRNRQQQGNLAPRASTRGGPGPGLSDLVKSTTRHEPTAKALGASGGPVGGRVAGWCSGWTRDTLMRSSGDVVSSVVTLRPDPIDTQLRFSACTPRSLQRATEARLPHWTGNWVKSLNFSAH